jgi:hypothetical protein
MTQNQLQSAILEITRTTRTSELAELIANTFNAYILDEKESQVTVRLSKEEVKKALPKGVKFDSMKSGNKLIVTIATEYVLDLVRASEAKPEEVRVALVMTEEERKSSFEGFFKLSKEEAEELIEEEYEEFIEKDTDEEFVPTQYEIEEEQEEIENSLEESTPNGVETSEEKQEELITDNNVPRGTSKNMKTTVKIETGVNYLSEVMLELPKDCIFDKGKVGCGGTTISIKSPESYVICVPFVSLIKNKVAQHPEVLGVYEGVTAKTIKDYVKNGGNKIMVTYDSLEKIMKYIKPEDYNLLVDELHILFLQYSFRREAVQKVLPNYNKFKSFCFMTATPVEKDFMLEELKSLPLIEAVWEDVREITVNSVKCIKDVRGTVIKTIEDFLSGKYEGNAYFFVNSVEFIKEMIEHCKLTDDNTRVIYSDNNKTQLAVKRGYTTDNPKKINFITSTAFEGADIYDENGKVFIVSDNKKPHTLTDISTSFQQIAGRIRNTKYWNTINHIFTETRYYNNLSYEEFRYHCNQQVAGVNKKIEQLMSLDEDVRKDITMAVESYVIKTDNIFSFDSNLVKIDLYNFKITKCLYKLRVNVVSALRAENFKVKQFDSEIENPIVNMSKVEKSFEEVVKELQTTEDEEIRVAAFEKYPFLEEAIEKIGYEGIAEAKYVITNVKRELINILDISNESKVMKMLLVNTKFGNGVFISSKDAKRLIETVYEQLGIKKTANIKDYFVVKDSKKWIDKKTVTGYTIIIPKIILN